MKGLYLLLSAVLLVYSSAAQQFVTDHQHHINQLVNAKDSLYEDILNSYDNFLARQPGNVKVQVERCRFIEKAYYDSYEDYNPNFDIAQACADSMIRKFPGNPEVLLYGTEFLYGDTLKSYLLQLEKNVNEDPDAWQSYTWEIYQKLAQQYSYENNHDHTIHYAELALQNNDTLDLSLLLGRAHKNKSNRINAIDVLVNDLDSTDTPWDLNQKGKLLLELGMPDKAIEAFTLASNKSAVQEDAGALAQAMIDNGLLDEGRAYLLKDYQSSSQWNSTTTLTALLNYDLKYGSADSARLDYNRLTEGNFAADAFGLYRLRLLVKNPLTGWSLSDIGRMFILLLVVAAAIMLPYLWILPVHYFGQYQKNKGIMLADASFHWGLKHLWVTSSAWLILTFLSSLIFYYPEVLSYFNDNYIDAPEVVTKVEADANIFFFVGLLIFSIAILRRDDIVEFFPKIKNNLNSIGVGIGLAILLRIATIAYVVMLRAMGVEFEDASAGMASITDVIRAINQYYNPYLGFLFVVIFAPFYEEILFRGVFLSACSRNMKFMLANTLQSIAFALVHQDLKYFLFYFAFGYLAGHFTRKSGSLIISTSMHMMNNLMAFIYILSMR